MEIASPLGVCIMKEASAGYGRWTSYSHYIHEILGHAGVCYTTVAPEQLPQALGGLRVLLAIGEAQLDEPLRQAIQTWVEAGGAYLSLAGECGLGGMLGVSIEPPGYPNWYSGHGVGGEGYLAPLEVSHSVLAHVDMPLHYFNSMAVVPAGAKVLAAAMDAHQRPLKRAAVLENAHGKGLCLTIAPDAIGTIVRMQQGIAVTRDGLPAPDGSAPVSDGLLKSDDGAVLDWLFDRRPVPGVAGYQAFTEPLADQWREIILRAVFYLAARQGVRLPLLWLYPRDLPAVGHLSHDSDNNDDAKALAMLDKLAEIGVKSTWCIICPGYSKGVIEKIRQAGHELAMHYDAIGRPWGQESFDRQWEELVRLFDGDKPVSNKNHYLRWEGDCEFFQWCVAKGIELDQSKGPTKTGAAGYNFGTCHVYRPVAPDGSVPDVLELITPTMDLSLFATEQLGLALLKAAMKHHGVLHLLFHPALGADQTFADMARMAARAREQGMEWWTAARISAWERARRSARWEGFHQDAGRCGVRLCAAQPLEHACVLWLGGPGQAQVNGREAAAKPVTRWGFEFQSVQVDIAERTGAALTFQ